MSVHPHSAQAYHEEQPNLSAREQAIVSWLKGRRKPATDRQVMQGLGFREPNAVRPRITELIDAKVLEEVGRTTCPTTDKTVRLVNVKRAPPQQTELAL